MSHCGPVLQLVCRAWLGGLGTGVEAPGSAGVAKAAGGETTVQPLTYHHSVWSLCFRHLVQK